MKKLSMRNVKLVFDVEIEDNETKEFYGMFERTISIANFPDELKDAIVERISEEVLESFGLEP